MDKKYIKDHINTLCKQKFFDKLNINDINLINSYIGNTIGEKLYNYVNNNTIIPKCPICHKNLPFHSFKEGYRKYCSKSCRAHALKHTKESLAKMQDSYKKTMISKYGVENGFQLEKTKNIIKNRNKEFFDKRNEKSKKVWIEKYGVDNPNKVKEIINKRITTNKLKYGNSCSLHGDNGILSLDDEIFWRQQVDNRKRHDFFIDRFFLYLKQNDLTYISGTLFKNELITYKCNKCGNVFNKKMSTYVCCPHCYGLKSHVSLEEKAVLAYIKSIYSGSILENDRKVISPLEIDIYLPELNLGIEYNGAYWHALRNCNHNKKRLICAEKGIKLIQIFDYDWNNNTELIKENLFSYIWNNTYSNLDNLMYTDDNLIYFNNCWPVPSTYKVIGNTDPKKIFLCDVYKNNKSNLFFYDCGCAIIKK